MIGITYQFALYASRFPHQVSAPLFYKTFPFHILQLGEGESMHEMGIRELNYLGQCFSSLRQRLIEGIRHCH